MDRLAEMLLAPVGRLVVNKTGLDGRYEFTLSYGRTALNTNPDVPLSATDAPSINDALQQQLGLRLVNDRALLEVLVIDSIERPTPN